MEQIHITVSETCRGTPWEQTLVDEYDISIDQPKDALKEIAKFMTTLDPHNTTRKNGLYVRAINEQDDVEAYLLIPTKEKGEKSFYIRYAYGNDGFDSSYIDTDEKVKYLVCLDEATNDYKSYKMYQQQDNDQFNVSYGRIGGADSAANYNFDKEGARFYPSNMFWVKYYEKIVKGYVDKSEEINLIVNGNAISANKPFQFQREMAKYLPIEDDEIRFRIEYLIESQRNYVNNNYHYTSDFSMNINSAAIQHAESILDGLKEIVARMKPDDTPLDTAAIMAAFREPYRQLLLTLPRKIRNVKEYIDRVDFDDATSPNYVSNVISQEQELLTALNDIYVLDNYRAAIRKNAEKDEMPKQTVLESFGISAHQPDFEEKFLVLDKMGQEAYSVSQIIAVTNNRTKDAYDQFRKDFKIHDGGCHLFWHGSRTENWWSIIKNGLSLNPDAIKTGKMFGQGLYFAPLAKKSMGYIDTRNSRWAHGSQRIGYLALYDVAMGKPYTTDCAIGSDFNFESLKYGCHSVWAKAGNHLYNDECIVYREDQCNIRYLVEIDCDRNIEYSIDLKAAREMTLTSISYDNGFLIAEINDVGNVFDGVKNLQAEMFIENSDDLVIRFVDKTSLDSVDWIFNKADKEYLTDVFMSKLAKNKEDFISLIDSIRKSESIPPEISAKIQTKPKTYNITL